MPRERLAQHLENDRRRPAKQQHAIHRRHRSEQAPSHDRRDIAITERRVVDESEIEKIGAFGRCIDLPISDRPDDHLCHVRSHQHQHRRDHHTNQVPPRAEHTRGRAGDTDRGGREKSVDMILKAVTQRPTIN